ncbi:MAG: hypothetical protein FWH00_00230 [Oscillospiraceae bacterium]|nr:hypothetical protein [Oscillospiraceae bacterium]
MRKIKILVYANVDFNLVDGSSVWLASLCDVLCGDPSFEIHAMLKSPLKDTTPIDGMANADRVTWLDPYKHFDGHSFQNRVRLAPEEAMPLLKIYGDEIGADFYVLRGMPLELLDALPDDVLSDCFLYTVIGQSEFDGENHRIVSRLLEKSAGLFAQTPLMRRSIAEWLGCDETRLHLMTPMIPDKPFPGPVFARNKDSRLVYSGKFSAMWYIQEIIDAVSVLHEEGGNILLDIAGDKFHTDVDKEALIRQFEEAPFITWHGKLNRAASISLIGGCDAGIGWRHPEMDESFEVSTKFLECAMAGKPVLLNPTPLYRELLGEDYPLFVDTPESFLEKTRLVLSDSSVYYEAARRCHSAARFYGYCQALERLRRAFLPAFFNKPAADMPMPVLGKKLRVVIAGHDLKFIRFFIDYLEQSENYDVRIDQFENHTAHDEEHSLRLLAWADVIFCEWGLGNAVWYSQNKRDCQKLIVRMHMQELNTPHPGKYCVNNIDRFVLIAPAVYEKLYGKFRLPREKMLLIWNAVDCEMLDLPKQSGARFNIGIMGICPRRKRVDLALDILELLLAKDRRYQLQIKGIRPEEHAWLWGRDDERAYYEEFYRRAGALGSRVVFSPFDTNVGRWFSQIGYLLSTSDFEGSHQAVAEAMAAGTVPVIRDWEGAASIYPREYIFSTAQGMAVFIAKGQADRESLKEYARGRFDRSLICRRLENILIGG